MTIHIIIPLEITSLPSDFSGIIGSTAELDIEAQGEGVTYQWYYKKSALAAFTKSTTASGKTAHYSLKLAEQHDGWKFFCLVTDQYGNKLRSNTVTVNVIPQPQITSQPTDFMGSVGATAKFTVAATGDGLTYQWYYKKTGAASFVKSSLASGKKATYSMTIAERHDGWQYYCIVTDAYGQTAQTDTVTIHLN